MKSVKKKDQFENLKYSIARIKTLSFFINELFHDLNPKKELKVELAQLLGINVEANIIDFRLKIYYFYLDKPTDLLTEIIIQNVFKVEELNTYLKNENLVLPPQLIVSLISMSISHGRSLLCQNLAGTVYQDFILPITNPADVAQQFFPQMFDENGEMK